MFPLALSQRAKGERIPPINRRKLQISEGQCSSSMRMSPPSFLSFFSSVVPIRTFYQGFSPSNPAEAISLSLIHRFPKHLNFFSAEPRSAARRTRPKNPPHLPRIVKGPTKYPQLHPLALYEI
jgi:hypothetical protein